MQGDQGVEASLAAGIPAPKNLNLIITIKNYQFSAIF